MQGLGINGEGDLRGQQANPGSPGKMAVKTYTVYLWLNPTTVKISLKILVSTLG